MSDENNNDRPDHREALQQVLQDWQPPSSNQQAIAFLFLSPAWADSLEAIVTEAQALLGGGDHQTQFVAVVGRGVVGSGQEVEDPTRHSMSFMGGILPQGSAIEVESFVNNDDISSTEKFISSPNAAETETGSNNHVNSQLVFADPYSTLVESVLQDCSNIVAGAVSVAAHKQQSTLANGDRVLPPGALIRVNFSGNLGIQVVVSRGCRPVGPTYRVTKVNGPAILELDSMRAIDRLQWTIENHCHPEDKDYIQTKGMTKGVLGGFYKKDDINIETMTDNKNQIELDSEPPEDFIIRQMTGFQPHCGGIILCGRPTVEEGDFFRFHVRSPSSALDDWRKIVKRAQTERLFLGDQAGDTVGALQISCAARGEALFDEPNTDLHHVQELIRTSVVRGGLLSPVSDQEASNDGSAPLVAGFFANAEISSLGNSIRMGANPDSVGIQQKSFMHGYASVVAMLCDYSKTNNQHDGESDTSTETTEIEALGIMHTNGTEVWA